MDEFVNETEGKEEPCAADCKCDSQCDKPKKSMKDKITGIFKKKK